MNGVSSNLSPSLSGDFGGDLSFLATDDERSSISGNKKRVEDNEEMTSVDQASHRVSSLILSSSSLTEKEQGTLRFRLSSPLFSLNAGEKLGTAEATGRIRKVDQVLDTMRALPLDIEIDRNLRELKILRQGYEEWNKGIVQGKNIIEKDILKKLKYLIKNKENILYGISQLAPEHYERAKAYLETVEAYHEWMDCRIPLIGHAIHWGFIQWNMHNLAKHQKRYQDLIMRPGHRAAISSSDKQEKLQDIKNIIDGFLYSIERNKGKVESKLVEKGADYLSQFSVLPFKKIAQISEKGAIKIKKCTLGLFKHLVGLWTTRNDDLVQREWLFHLRPGIVVDIYYNPKNLTAEEVTLMAQRGDDQENLIKQLDNFGKSLVACGTIEEVREKCQSIGISLSPTTTLQDFYTIFESPRFQHYLAHCFYYSKGQQSVTMDENRVNSLLAGKKQDFEEKINQAIPFIAGHIVQCQGKTWDDIEKHFANLHIHLNTLQLSQPAMRKHFDHHNVMLQSDPLLDAENPYHLPVPPKNKAEWDQCIQHDVFCKMLAAKWVEYQETKATLAIQALRQLLLSKHNVERNFLFVRAIKHTIGLILNSVQIFASCATKAAWLAVKSVIEILCTDLTKIGIPGLGFYYVCYPFYPDLSSKLDSLLMMIGEHFYGIQYKPHEYSLECYQLKMKAHFFGVATFFHTLLFYAKQILLWLNIQLVDNLIMRMNKQSLNEDESYAQLNLQYEQRRLDYLDCMKELESHIKELKIKDAKLLGQPQIGQTTDQVNPFRDLAKELEDANIDYFPSKVLEFFEIHVGFKLTNGNKNELQAHLEKFFAKGERDFIASYDLNRLAYLKV